jgi:hypothetical protein
MNSALPSYFLSLSLLLSGANSFAQVTEPHPSLQPPEAAKTAGHPGEFEGQKSIFDSNGILRLDNDWNPDENGNRQYNLRTQRFELQGSLRLLQTNSFAQETLFVLRTRMEKKLLRTANMIRII